MGGSSLALSSTLAGREYAGFLKDFGFELVLRHAGDYFSCTVVGSGEVLLAFTYQMNLGENVCVAGIDAPIDPLVIAERSNGWRLIGEVWTDFYCELHTAQAAMPYPSSVDRETQVSFVDRALRTFIAKLRKGEIAT
jgi:hypothetical protein